MAIQERRGVYADFDKTKLMPGEPAVVLSGDPNSLDGAAAYIAFSSSNVKRIVTDDEVTNMIENELDDAIDNVAVRFDQSQSLTSAQKSTARQNIGIQNISISGTTLTITIT